MTQRSPCYSAVSSSLTNPLPDCSNYSPLPHALPHQYFTRARPFTKPLRWRLVLHCCSLYSLTRLQSLRQNLVGTNVFGGKPQCLEEAEQQAEASGYVPPPPLQIVISTPFCLFLFSLYLYPLSAPVLNPLSSLISLSLSTITSFSSDQFSVLLR